MDTFIEITFDLFCILFFAALMYGLIYPIYLGPEKYKAFKEKMRREEEERRRIKKLRKAATKKDRDEAAIIYSCWADS